MSTGRVATTTELNRESDRVGDGQSPPIVATSCKRCADHNTWLRAVWWAIQRI